MNVNLVTGLQENELALFNELIESNHQFGTLPDIFRRKIQRSIGYSSFVFEQLLKDSAFYIELFEMQHQEQKLDSNSLLVDYKVIQEYIVDSEKKILLLETESSVIKSARIRRNRLMSMIALAHLTDAISMEEELELISSVGQCLVSALYHWLYEKMISQWGVPLNNLGEKMSLLILAMGKFGGGELNFSSDIDLIFFYEKDGQTQRGKRSLEHQQFFIRIGQQLIALIANVTSDGFVFRVDMRLRPYGESGPLAMSFSAAEDYYQEQGREWERFAFIKARLITGREEEQRSFYSLIKPFVYRRYIDFGVLESIRKMKSMIESEVRRKGLVDNIKLGTGGIREAEFIVQALQLVRGGREPELQQKNFLNAIMKIGERNIIDEVEAKNLRFSYLFLRKIEHRLQNQNDQQTQTIPSEVEWREKLSYYLNYSSLEAFEKDVQQSLANISSAFSNLFRSDHDDESLEEFEPYVDEFTIQKHLEHYGNVDEDLQAKIISRLSQFMESQISQKMSAKGRERMEILLPRLLHIVVRQSNPLQTLERVLELLRSVAKRTAYLVLLSENLPILEHLCKLSSQSFWISERLAQFPVLLDELLFPQSLYKPLSKEHLSSELRRQLLRIDVSDEEQQQEQLRVFKQTNELRVAAACLNGNVNVKLVSDFLSDIAMTVVEKVTALAWRNLCGKHGVPNIEGASIDNLIGFAVIGYGKIGGKEIGFGSDLDLVFMYQGKPEEETLGSKPISHVLFFTRLAQKIIHLLSIRTFSGVLYEVDTRLRPSGNSGLLVTHCDAFREYQLEQAWVWEHQAITRAAGVCGDPFVIEHFNKTRQQILSKHRDPDELMKEVLSMREKMKTALDKSSEEFFDIKQGDGGIVDIEFLVQFLLLKHGEKLSLKECPSRTTLQIQQLLTLNILDEPQAKQLIYFYRSYREQMNILCLTEQDKLKHRTRVDDTLNELRSTVSKLVEQLFIDNKTISD